MLSEFLKTKRIEAGLSQADISKALGYSTPQFISNWERGISAPPVSHVKKLANLYKVSADDLFREVLLDALDYTQTNLITKFQEAKE